MSLRAPDSLFGSDYNAPSSRGSMQTSLWSSLFSESNVSSDVRLYRRASWLEEYAGQRARFLDERSESRRERRAEKRARFWRCLFRLIPCARPGVKPKTDRESVGSSRSSLSSQQTYVCFDVEQPCDACHELVVSRAAGLAPDVLVAFRLRTNAPTRYIVYPNAGILSEQNNAQKVLIELVGNRYNPYHRLIVQAIQIQSEAEARKVWRSNRLKQDLQAIPLELSTTLINIDRTNTLSTSSSLSADGQASLSSVLEQSSRTGEDRLRELDALCAMLKADLERLEANAAQADQLRVVLERHVEQRKRLVRTLHDRLKDKEAAYVRLNRTVETQELTLKQLQQPRTADQKNCRIS